MEVNLNVTFIAGWSDLLYTHTTPVCVQHTRFIIRLSRILLYWIQPTRHKHCLPVRHHYPSHLVVELNKSLCWHLVITFFLLVELTNVDAPSYWTPFSQGDAWDHVSLFAYAQCFRGCIHDNPHLTHHNIIPASICNYIIGNMYTEIRAYTYSDMRKKYKKNYKNFLCFLLQCHNTFVIIIILSLHLHIIITPYPKVTDYSNQNFQLIFHLILSKLLLFIFLAVI